MWLFLVTLAVLFVASIVAYLVIRAQASEWPPAGTPPLPKGLWISTALIAVTSLGIEWARVAVKRGQALRVRAAFGLMLVAGLAFLVSQTVAWFQYVAAGVSIGGTLHGWLFYFMTALHAAHVLGGLVPLIIMTVNAYHGRVSFLQRDTVHYLAMYWHFLGVVWVVLYGLLAWP